MKSLSRQEQLESLKPKVVDRLVSSFKIRVKAWVLRQEIQEARMVVADLQEPMHDLVNDFFNLRDEVTSRLEMSWWEQAILFVFDRNRVKKLTDICAQLHGLHQSTQRYHLAISTERWNELELITRDQYPDTLDGYGEIEIDDMSLWNIKNYGRSRLEDHLGYIKQLRELIQECRDDLLSLDSVDFIIRMQLDDVFKTEQETK